MRDEIANLVHPVLTYGLRLRDRLEAGEKPSLELEQAVLKGMLLSELEAQRYSDFGGDVERDVARNDEEAAPLFLGIRYALVCWLDELFILYSPWEAAWNEHKLEAALYGTNDRAWKFWQQARLAESRPGGDALEAFYLCVMLGFRGELRESPEQLRLWTAAAQAQVTRNRAGGWTPPPGIEPPTYVPPLRGRDKLQRMVLVSGMTLLVLIPIVVFFLVRRLGQ